MVPLVFYSYSHEDTKFLKALIQALTILKRQNIIRSWSDLEIVAGEEWRTTILTQLEAADLILLLVSSSFIASDFCWGNEMTYALKKHESGKARVIPIIIRPGDYEGARFKEIQALPRGAKAVTLWSNRDEAWADVSKGIRKAVEELKQKSPAKQRLKKPPVSRSLVEAPSKRIEPEGAKRSGSRIKRTIYDARNGDTLPGRIVRREGEEATKDMAVNEAYDGLALAYNFFWDVFKRNSIDGKGMSLEATVHYGNGMSNAFYTGKHLAFGDGDGKVFNRFTIAPDVIVKEFAMGVVQADTKLEYWNQSGCIFQSFAIVFSALGKQYALKQTSQQASWLLGEGLLTKKINGKAIQSLANPGTAYNDPALGGKDPQPAHMKKYVKTDLDSGGIHINSGILNRAFYLLSIALGGYAWEKGGRIWYESMRDARLKPKATFAELAAITDSQAKRLFGRTSDEAEAVKQSWELVGVKITKDSTGIG